MLSKTTKLELPYPFWNNFYVYPSRARRRIDYVDPKITVATTVCGARRDEATTMLKSLLILNQDAALHLIVFSDSDTVLDVAQDVRFSHEIQKISSSHHSKLALIPDTRAQMDNAGTLWHGFHIRAASGKVPS